MRCGLVPPPRASGDLWARLRGAGARVRTLDAAVLHYVHRSLEPGFTSGSLHALPLRSLKRILDRQRDKQRSTIQQSFWGGSAGMPGSDCALLPRHHRAQVFYLRTGQMAWTPSRKMIFSLRLTGSTSQPIEFPGGESGRDGEVSSFPPLPPVHQRQGFRITGRPRNGGKTRGQDNPSLARDNART